MTPLAAPAGVPGAGVPALGLDFSACYRAIAGRDTRWDGRLFLGVASTGIYCRPSCPARKPLPQNCRFFAAAAAAVAAGFRACKRCRPDAQPGTRDDNVRGELVGRAVRLIRDGVVDEAGVPGLATRLAVSERHLRRVLVHEIGASPQQLNRTRRAHAARTLIEQTSLPLSEVAFAAGFGSVRQFNGVMLEEFGTQPGTLPRGRTPQRAGDPVSDHAPMMTLRLRRRPPFATDALRAFLGNHAVPGRELVHHDGEQISRIVDAPGGPACATVRWGDDPEQVTADLRLSRLDDLMPVIAALRRWLDLDADPAATDEALSTDPLLAALVTKRPGIRIPGSVDGGELAMNTVLGQQVSIPAARTLQARLVAAFGRTVAGERLTEGLGPTEFRSAPDPTRIAATAPEELRDTLRITSARARSLHALATALADGLRLDPGVDRAETRARLLALPGIGPWTTEVIALRALGDPDAFPAGDLVLRRALGSPAEREVRALAERWRPWRGSALMHLWTEAAHQ